MTEREKLIELLLNSDPLHERDLDDDLADGEIESIADYLLANGVIVPPCKVGDIVYTIFEGKIGTLKVVYAKTEESAEGVSKYYDAENKFLKMPFAECHIGKSIFLTPETVEQALKEREQG